MVVTARSQNAATAIVKKDIANNGWESVYWADLKPIKTMLDTSDAQALEVLTDDEAKWTCPQLMKGGR
jgi:hypothetical protein